MKMPTNVKNYMVEGFRNNVSNMIYFYHQVAGSKSDLRLYENNTALIVETLGVTSMITDRVTAFHKFRNFTKPIGPDQQLTEYPSLATIFQQLKTYFN